MVNSLFSQIPWTEAYLISEWIIRIGMVIVVPYRRSPAAAKGWLLLAFFVPWIGLLAYLLLGRSAPSRWQKNRLDKLPHVLAGILAPVAKLTQHFYAKQADLGHGGTSLAHRLSVFAPLHGNTISVTTNYNGFIDKLISDIDAAKSHVHLMFYIFSYDHTSQRVMLALERAVRRGVKCRVLIDDIGSGLRGWRALSWMTKHGIDAQRMLPIDLVKRGFDRLHLRNHRKLVVIDGKVGYMGSQNIINAKHQKRWWPVTSGLPLINEELMVRVDGPVVLQMQALFVADWFLETNCVLDMPNLLPATAAKGEAIAHILPSGPDYPDVGVDDLIVTMIHSASKRVVITTPYFIPTEGLLQALRTAVRRGVEVHLQLSKKSNYMTVRLAQRSYYDELLHAGVKIHLYRQDFLHAKHITLDDSVTLVGSSNVDIRSFIHNAEVSMIIYDADTNATVRAEQERTFAASQTLELEAWERRARHKKILENIARLLSPLL